MFFAHVIVSYLFRYNFVPKIVVRGHTLKKHAVDSVSGEVNLVKKLKFFYGLKSIGKIIISKNKTFYSNMQKSAKFKEFSSIQN